MSFVPLFRNPHLQTIAGRLWPRPKGAFPTERKLYRTAADVQVLVVSQKPPGASRGDIVLVHGLEGSAEAGYMRGMALCAVQAGYTAHCLNLRTCGGTEHLAKSIYHAGLTTDLLAVLRDLESHSRSPIWLVGFSLGGNLVAKLAGELAENAFPLLAGVVCVSAALDLGACARRINQPDNRLYEYRFLRMMRSRARNVFGATPADLRGIRSVIDMDDRVTAPRCGFESADHYYRTQSADQFLDRIRVPALFITSRDDTFIPFQIYSHPAFANNPHLHLLATDHGGHLGFLSRTKPHLWVEQTIMDWIAGHQPANTCA